MPMWRELASGEIKSGTIAAMPGTCGELFQGTLHGKPCLVSLPIDRWSFARVKWRERPDLWYVPISRTKTLEAMRLAAKRWGRIGSASLDWASQLPEGKGFGSSTADIAAALFALAEALNRSLDPWEIIQLAVSIEPTDSSPLPNLALMDHRGGAWWEPLGPPPPMDVLIVDTGGTVDTMAFNRMDYAQVAIRYGDQHAAAFDYLESGLRSECLRSVGEAATLSARVQQKILPKPYFDDILSLSGQTGAVGVNVAHSGTLVGLLYAAGSVDQEHVSSYIERSLPSKFKLCWHRAVAGGARWIDRSHEVDVGLEFIKEMELLA
ncbi:MAG: GHMP kinase [Anaerolineales bacterium]